MSPDARGGMPPMPGNAGMGDGAVSSAPEAAVAGAPVASPCVSVCVVDPMGTGICTGCGRSLDEIAAWIDLDDAQRRTVIARLPGRLAALRERARQRKDRNDAQR